MNTYQTFIHLLIKAHSALQSVDDFDLHSDNSASQSEWKRLLAEENESFVALIEHVVAHADEIKEISKQ